MDRPGHSDPLTVGLLLVGLFVAGQKRSPQPIMPLRMFKSRERAGAYAARFLFNGACSASSSS